MLHRWESVTHESMASCVIGLHLSRAERLDHILTSHYHLVCWDFPSM